MKVQRIADPADFDASLAAILASAPGRVFVVLFGTEQADTQQSWCPDCVVADPLIRRHILKVPDSTLIEAPVGDRAVYRAKDHPYRIHPKLAVTAVPTLYEFSKDGEVIKRLVENEAADVELLEQFISSV